MTHFVCSHCGDDVPTRPGYELTAAARHAAEAGHPDAGLTPAPKGRPRRRPLPGWVEHRRTPGRWWQRWHALPLPVRLSVVVTVWGSAYVIGNWYAEQREPPPPPRCPQVSYVYRTYC